MKLGLILIVRFIAARVLILATGLILLASVLPAVAIANEQSRSPGSSASASNEGSGGAFGEGEFPVAQNGLEGVLRANTDLLDPNASPPGANDWECKPSEENPEPVVLLHGMGGSAAISWQMIAPALANAGHCVFSLTYGQSLDIVPFVGGLTDLRTSGEQISGFVDKVLAETGADKVNIVGHSEGTTQAAYLAKVLDRADDIDTIVGFSPNYAGTTLWGLASLGTGAYQIAPQPIRDLAVGLCGGCVQFAPNSEYMKELNAGGTAGVPDVNYVNIQSTIEAIVTPNVNGTLDIPNATNIFAKNECGLNLSDHIGLIYDQAAVTHALNALDGKERPVKCSLSVPYMGTLATI